MQSTNLCLIAYNGNSAFGVNVPAMNNSSGYFVFKNETNTEVPTTSILDSNVIYKDILGCTNEEQCIVINYGTGVSKLTIPSESGTYLLNVSSSGISFEPQPTKLSTTYTFNWGGSGHSVVNEALSTSITLSSSSKYLFTFDIGLKCTNYEQALIGFENEPILLIGVRPMSALRMNLGAATSTLFASGTCVGSPATSGQMSIAVTRDGDDTISHIYSHFQVTVVEL